MHTLVCLWVNVKKMGEAVMRHNRQSTEGKRVVGRLPTVTSSLRICWSLYWELSICCIAMENCVFDVCGCVPKDLGKWNMME